MPQSNNLDIHLDKLRTLAIRFAENANEIDFKAQWPEENMRTLQAAGFGGLCVPTEIGGMGFSLLGLAKSCEIIGQACASTSMCFGMHVVGSAVIAAKATEDQKERFLAPIARGEHLTTLALSEPGTGSHFYFPECELTEQDSEFFKINGKKSFVTNGAHADSLVVSTTTEHAKGGPGKFSCIVVEGKSPNLIWSKPWNGVGMRGNSSQSLEIQNAQVRRSNLLGNEGDQIWYVFEVVAPYFLMAMAGTYLGIAEAALSEALMHLKKRSYCHSGSALADQAVLQHKVGSLWADLMATKELLYKAATLGDAQDAGALPYILSSKAQVADTAIRATNECMTLMGGIAYSNGSKSDRHLRDARAAHVMAPTTDILRTWVGRSLLDKPLLGD